MVIISDASFGGRPERGDCLPRCSGTSKNRCAGRRIPLHDRGLSKGGCGRAGSSGGPIFDTDGNIYAVQSQNATLPLGFKGTVETNGKMIEENQFFNVGIGVHTAIIEALLTRHNIKFDVAH